MYVDTSTLKRNGKSYTRYLLRTSFRENGKVKHSTVANISNCTRDEIKAIKLALKHKKNLGQLGVVPDVKIVLGKRVGAVWLLAAIAKKIGLEKSLGRHRDGKLALMQVIARTINQGSRLSAVRLAKRHALCEILNIDKLDEDDLYQNLGWLAEHQEEIEKRLFDLRFPNEAPALFLYDVTSSYFEGMCNELADWGYNRDKKKGKKQIVIGLLAGPDGLPVAVRVFRGNTSDPQTVSEQIKILAKNFGVTQTILVGDRGMLKGPQIEELPEDFRYITAITKPQIQKLLGEGIFQYSLFTEQVCEVESEDVRYVLRRNPVRAKDTAETRKQKHESLQRVAQERTEYLAKHSKADVQKAVDKVQARIEKLKAAKWLVARADERTIVIDVDADALSEAALLDGCYVIKSDVQPDDADAQTLHDRYCDLENVERSFRTMKMTHLEMRPIFVKKGESTRGHAFVVMLALLVQRELEKHWADLDMTVKEGIDELAAIHVQEVSFANTKLQDVPTPNKIGKQLLAKAGVKLPSVLPQRTPNVRTKKNLVKERKRS